MAAAGADIGRVTIFNEGAVAFGVEDLHAVLLAGDPRENREFPDKDYNIMLLPDGLRLRWLGALPARHALAGEPPIDYLETVAHTKTHEQELAILPDYDVGVPAHTTLVVEVNPHDDYRWPVVYTAVAPVPGAPLVVPKGGLRGWLGAFTFEEAAPEKLLAVGVSFIDFYSRAGATDRPVLHPDASHPRQLSNDDKPVLYDIEPRLLANGPHAALRAMQRWHRRVPGKAGEELRAYAQQALKKMTT